MPTASASSRWLPNDRLLSVIRRDAGTAPQIKCRAVGALRWEAPDGPCARNQSRAWAATAGSAPGSSHRWVAPGPSASLLRQSKRFCARWLSSMTAESWLPTMSGVGARTEPTRSRPGAVGLHARRSRPRPRSVPRPPTVPRRPGARAEVPVPVRLGAHPLREVPQPLGQQLHVEHPRSVEPFDRRQQVEQQGGQASLVQRGRHESITWAEPAAAVSVYEDHQTARQPARQACRTGRPRRPRARSPRLDPASVAGTDEPRQAVAALSSARTSSSEVASKFA
jgi:hypothetical protein